MCRQILKTCKNILLPINRKKLSQVNSPTLGIDSIDVKMIHY